MTRILWRATTAQALRAAITLTATAAVLIATSQVANADTTTPSPTDPVSSAIPTATASLSPSPSVATSASPSDTASAPSPTDSATPSVTVSPSDPASPTGAATSANPGSPSPTDTSAPSGGTSVPVRKALTLAPAALTPASAVATGTACALSCDLYAREGVLTLPGITDPVPVWSFTANLTDPVVLPGATLIATAGADLTITLHNNLPAADGAVALELPGVIGLAPDLTGAASGATTTYTLASALLKPGTYLYQAGATANGRRQQAMGLSGLLIVRPVDFVGGDATSWTDLGLNTGTQFTAESTVEVSEIDPEFNADPNGSDLVEYAPTEFLLNGKPFDAAHADLSMIAVNPGDHTLLRYADLGLREHSMGLLGLRQTEVGQDSQPLRHQQDVATVFLTPSQVTDSVALVDPSSSVGMLYPLYDAGLHLNNDAAPGLGGMLAALQVGSGDAANAGPVATAVLSKPDVNDGTSDVTLTAHLVADAGHQVTGAEWFLDTVRQAGTGFSASPTDALASTVTYSTPLPAPSVDVSFTIPAASLDAYLAAQAGKNGKHTLWVRGEDDTNTWGTAAGDVFSLNLDGPISSALTVDPTSTDKVKTLSKVPADSINVDPSFAANTGVDVTVNPGDIVVQGTADSSLAGWDIQSAQYCIDYSGTGDCPAAASGPVGLLAGPGSTAALAVVIPASQLSGLPAGAHHVSVRAYEAPSANTDGAGGRYGSWIDPGSTVTFVVDTQGPVATALALDPNPNNGFESNSGNLGFLDSLKVTATLVDTATGGSTLADGEVFVGGSQLPDGSLLDPQGHPIANGTGAQMVPGPGQWGTGTSETAYAFIPLAVVRSFPAGAVKFFVHGKDAAGNWGPFSETDLTLDKTAPSVTAFTVTGTGQTPRTVNLTATDAATPGGLPAKIVAAEYFLSPACGAADPGGCVVDPGQGAGTAVAVSPQAATVSLTLHVTFPAPRNGRVLSVRVKDAAGNWSVLSNYRFH